MLFKTLHNFKSQFYSLDFDLQKKSYVKFKQRLI